MIRLINALAPFLIFLPSTEGFSITTQAHFFSKFPSSSKTVGFRDGVHASSVGDQDPTMDIEEAKNLVPPEMLMSDEELWKKQLESDELQEIRREMVAKYTSLGNSLEVAEAEVDAFLGDREKSQQFVEMRRYAQAQVDDLSELGGVGPLFLAFLIGFVATVGPKLLAASH